MCVPDDDSNDEDYIQEELTTIAPSDSTLNNDQQARMEGMKVLVGKWKATHCEDNEEMKKILVAMGVPKAFLGAAIDMKELVTIEHVEGLTFQEQIWDVEIRPKEEYTLGKPYEKKNVMTKEMMQVFSDFKDGKHCAKVEQSDLKMEIERWVEGEGKLNEVLVIAFKVQSEREEISTKRFYKRKTDLFGNIV